MSIDDKFLKILDKISEVNERTIRLETKVETIEKDIDHIKVEDARQNELLDEHIQGVKTNTGRLELEKAARLEEQLLLKSRVDELEEIPKFLKSFKKVMMYLAAIAGAGLTLTKFLELW